MLHCPIQLCNNPNSFPWIKYHFFHLFEHCSLVLFPWQRGTCFAVILLSSCSWRVLRYGLEPLLPPALALCDARLSQPTQRHRWSKTCLQRETQLHFTPTWTLCHACKGYCVSSSVTLWHAETLAPKSGNILVPPEVPLPHPIFLSIPAKHLSPWLRLFFPFQAWTSLPAFTPLPWLAYIPCSCLNKPSGRYACVQVEGGNVAAESKSLDPHGGFRMNTNKHTHAHTHTHTHTHTHNLLFLMNIFANTLHQQ